VVERHEPEAVGGVDDGGQVRILLDLILEATLHPERIEEQVDLAVGERQDGGFLPTVERELEVVGVRTLGPGDITRRELGALVEVVLVAVLAAKLPSWRSA
jgi:hypothetical protein